MQVTSSALARLPTTGAKSNAASDRWSRKIFSAVAMKVRAEAPSDIQASSPKRFSRSSFSIAPTPPASASNSAQSRLTGHRVTHFRIEEALAVRPDHDEREVNHPAVERDRPVVVLRIPELLQLGDDRDGIVGDEAADVEELVPEVAVEPVLRVVRGDGGRVGGHVFTGLDGADVGDVERAVVGEVEVSLAILVGLQLGADLERGGQVAKRLLAVGGADLAPPDVLLVGGEEHGEMGLHGVGGVGGVPDVDEMALGRRHWRHTQLANISRNTERLASTVSGANAPRRRTRRSASTVRS